MFMQLILLDSRIHSFKKYVVLIIACVIFLTSKQAFAGVLTPGTIFSCGEMATIGTYTLSSTSTFAVTPGTDCFIVDSGGTSTQTIINGNGRTITGNIDGNAQTSAGLGYSFTIQNITVIGTTSADGASSTGSVTGGTGGSIIATNASSTSFSANGGMSGTTGAGGAGGNITITNSTTTSILTNGGASQHRGSGAGGTIIVSNSSVGSISSNAGIGNGTNNTDGSAGNVTISNSTIGSITANGGTGSKNSGAGGAISVATSTTGSISSIGGGTAVLNTYGGSGGSITLTNSTSTSLNSSGGSGYSSPPYTGGSPGTITINSSTVSGSVTSNAGNGTSVISGGTITISTSTIGSVISNGGANSSGGGGNGGSINATSSIITSITSTGGSSVSATGGSGGSINLFNSTTTSSISANGAGSYNSGNGGSVTITGNQLSIQNISISVSAGTNTGGSTGTNGTLTFNYNIIQYSNLTLSALSNIIFNGPGNLPGSLGSFAGGVYPVMAINTLSPGTINSCGRIYTPGIYNLGSNINLSGVCITVATSSVIINGSNGSSSVNYSITGNIVGDGLTYGKSGYTFTLQNVDVFGTTSANGIGDDGSCTLGGGNGGNITMSNATSTVITADAGNINYFGCDGNSISGGNGGSIHLSGTNINLSTNVMSAKGGYGTGAVNGSITINYSNTLNILGLYISALANMTVNSPLNTPGSLGVSGGGFIGTLPGGTILNSSQCNLAFPGTYTLGSNISGNCTITANGATLNGAGYTVTGQIVSGPVYIYDGGHSFTIQNITVTGTTTSASSDISAGVSCGGQSVFGSNLRNAGNITIVNSTTSAVVANGGTVFSSTWPYGACSGQGVGGSIAITNSKFSYISTYGSYNGASLTQGLDNTVTITGDTLDLSSIRIDTMDGYSGSEININYNKLITNSSTYFGGDGAYPLVVNSFAVGNISGVYNPSGLYFNSTTSGAANDGDWNDALNWWSDTLFNVPAHAVPSGFQNYVVDSNVTSNTGISPITANTVTFNNAINAINIYASQVIFNGTSRNMGIITGGQAIFNGNVSENDATSSIFIETPHGVNTYYQAITSSADGTKLLASDSNNNNIYTSSNSGSTWVLKSTIPATSDPSLQSTDLSISISFGSLGQGIVTSSDGTKSAVISNSGQIFTTSDSGSTWTGNSPYRTWTSITSSADGTKLAASSRDISHLDDYSEFIGSIYVSTNSGSTWTLSTSSKPTSWTTIVASPDGTKLIAVGTNGTYISNNFGTTWTLSTSSPTVSQFLYSGDGTKLYGIGNDGKLYTSVDFGVTWNSTTPSPSLPGGHFVSSNDGTELVAVGYGTSVYISKDSGATWTPNGPIQSWTGVALSSDGSKIYGITANSGGSLTGQIYTMSNSPTTVHSSGTIASSTPVRQYTANTVVGTRNFTNTGSNWIIQAVGAVVDISSSTYNTTVDTFQALNGGSFVVNPSINSGAAVVPVFTISSPANSTSTPIKKWAPLVNWGAGTSTAVTCIYSYDNFATTHTVNCANNGSDIPKPTSAGTTTLSTQATDSRGDFAQQSATFIYDNVSPIYTSCGADVLDESTRQYYYLTNNLIGNCTVTADVTLQGASTTSVTGYTVNGNIIATSNGNGHNIILKNITVTGSINASGANNTAGKGYKGGTILIDPSVTGSVISNGGDGTIQGGNGGNITIASSTEIASSTPISTNGGNATICGYGGSGGSITLTASLYDGVFSNHAGNDKTATFANGGYCQNPISSSAYLLGGSSGSVSISGQYSPPTLATVPNSAPVPVAAPVIGLVQPTGGLSGVVSSLINQNPSPLSNLPTPVALRTFQAVATEVVNNVVDTATNVINSPASKSVQTTGLFAGILATVAMYAETGFATPLAATEIPLIPIRLWGLVAMGLGIRKKSRSWGTVYDSVTKQPIDPAFVTVKDMSGKTVAESFTDIDGRYGFLLPDGQYTISVEKTNYEFPSKKLAGKTQDELYNDLYFGEPVTVVGGQVLDKNIPMDQKNFDWNEYAKKQQNAFSFHTRNEKPWAVVSTYVYDIGLAISVVTTVIHPTTYNLIILALYIVIFMIVRFGIKRKKLGLITDKQTHQPLSYAIIRITGADHQVLLRSGVSDANGHYYAIVPKGEYYIDIDRKNLDGTYSKAYQSPLISNDSGIVNKDLLV